MAAKLRIGPLLRYVDDTRATIWVETSQACEVEILGHRSPTFEVHGHHYALVVITGLAPGSVTPYRVVLDGETVWPASSSGVAPSVIRTWTPGGPFRLVFGSCRRAAPLDEPNLRRFGADALVALAQRMATAAHDQWPDLLFLGGDQVYADEPSDPLRARLRQRAQLPESGSAARRDPGADAREEIQTFDEYSWLYDESWTEPSVAWLLSTVPTLMMLDDHDLRDDWNTSVAWRERMSSQPWWRARVVGGLGSYWVYQHLGNLSPEALAADPLLQTLRTEPDSGARARALDEVAWQADAEPASARWSVARDLGCGNGRGDGSRVNGQGDGGTGDGRGADAGGPVARLVVLDTRCSRSLAPGRRAMLDDVEWAWARASIANGAPADHVIIGSTLPVLMLPAIHQLEGWCEAVAEGAWGRRWARLGERLRQGLDLEHWAAFRRSFDALVELLGALTRRVQPPASVLILSGDVHSSYLAQARLPADRLDGAGPATRVWQLTMSPFRNPLDRWIRVANRVMEWPLLSSVARRIASRAGVRDPGIRWGIDHGPWFDNGLMTVVLNGRSAHAEVEHAGVDGGRHVLRRTATIPLA